MKRLFLLSSTGLVACSGVVSHQHSQLMQQIEERVKLPKGADSLGHYARYYASDGQNIVAIYITIVDRKNRFYDLPLGHRRWLDDHRNLPAISDGGCSVVDVVYDAQARSEPEAFCHGEA